MSQGGTPTEKRTLARVDNHRGSTSREADMASTLEKLYRQRQSLSFQVDDLAAVREVSLAVGSILDFKDMIRAILDQVTSHFGVAKALIYLASQDEKTFEVVGARANDKEIPLARILQRNIASGNSGHGALAGSSGSLVRKAAIERREIIEAREGRGVIAAVPLITKNRVVGVLKLSDPDTTALTAEKCRKLHSIAGAIAVALENSRLYTMAVTDGLTGLYVHRHFQQKLEEEFIRSVRYRKDLSLLMIDIDHFKNFNDTYGHTTGDRVLRGVAAILSEEARETDIVCRYGGEEMALVCPETSLPGAYNIAERIRARIEDHAFQKAHTESSGAEESSDPDHHEQDSSASAALRVTVSIGVAAYRGGMKTRVELIERADAALYRAKNNGRNKVESFDPILIEDAV